MRGPPANHSMGRNQLAKSRDGIPRRSPPSPSVLRSLFSTRAPGRLLTSNSFRFLHSAVAHHSSGPPHIPARAGFMLVEYISQFDIRHPRRLYVSNPSVKTRKDVRRGIVGLAHSSLAEADRDLIQVPSERRTSMWTRLKP